jgi:negative regulator of flagellin synthesis FlgM
MNINDGLHNLSEPAGVTETSRISPVQRQGSASVPSTGALGQDSAEVSLAASLANRAMQVPDVRMDKVAAVQHALNNGTYSVAPEDVAEKLVRQMISK